MRVWLQMPKNIARDAMVQGIVIYSPRARSIAAWLQSMELCFLRVSQLVRGIEERPYHNGSGGLVYLSPGELQQAPART